LNVQIDVVSLLRSSAVVAIVSRLLFSLELSPPLECPGTPSPPSAAVAFRDLTLCPEHPQIMWITTFFLGPKIYTPRLPRSLYLFLTCAFLECRTAKRHGRYNNRFEYNIILFHIEINNRIKRNPHNISTYCMRRQSIHSVFEIFGLAILKREDLVMGLYFINYLNLIIIYSFFNFFLS